MLKFQCTKIFVMFNFAITDGFRNFFTCENYPIYGINLGKINFTLCIQVGPKIFSMQILWFTVQAVWPKPNDQHVEFYLSTFNMFGSKHFWNQFNSSPSCKTVLAHTKLDAWLISWAGHHTHSKQPTLNDHQLTCTYIMYDKENWSCHRVKFPLVGFKYVVYWNGQILFT